VADDVIQLPDDSTNTGKFVRTTTKVVGANTVHSYYHVITDETAEVHAACVTAAPGGTDGGLVTRNIPSGTQVVSGTVTVSGGGSGGLTDTELRATPVPVSGTITHVPSGTQSVSGTVTLAGGSSGLTDAELRATPVDVAGTVTAVPSGTQAVGGTVTAVASGSTTVTGTVTNVPSGTQAVSGTVTAVASGSTTVVGTVTAVASGTQTVDGTVTVSGTVPVSGSFYQATQPISGTVTAVPSGTTTVAGTVTNVPSGTQTVGGTVTNVQSGTAAVTGTVTTVPSGTQTVTGTVTTSGAAQAQTFMCGVKFTPAVTVSRDFWVLSGSATKTVRVRKIWISGSSTAAQNVDLQIIKRSTANTGGTSTTPTCVPLDSGNDAGTAMVRAYTAVSTEGTPVGTVWAGNHYFSIVTATATSMVAPVLLIDFTEDGCQPVVLRGVAQSLAIQVATAFTAGPSARIVVEFTEE
jgi:fibronectin-binding autotransporter adhesin